jgi:hypothetical protein
MVRRSCSLFSLVALSAAGSICCAPSAVNLQPRHVPADRAAIFGHIDVTNMGVGVTDTCKVTFVGAGDHDAVPLSLDKTGWVFTTSAPGLTHLSKVSCEDGRPTFRSDEYVVQVPAHGGLAYFGHVQIDLYVPMPDRATMILGAAVGGVAGAAIQAQGIEGPGPAGSPTIRAVDHFPEALAEYQRRFGADGGVLVPERELLADIATIPTSSPPVVAAGFPLGQDIAGASQRCTAAAFSWEASGGGFTCSGPAADLGMPARVKLDACGPLLCSVTVDAGADGAGWKVLAERYGQLLKRLAQEHGDKRLSTLRSKDDCTDGIRECFKRGRARADNLWRWPDHHRTSLVLDGGPTGGAPSLRLVYATPAVPEERGASEP